LINRTNKPKLNNI